MKSILSPGIGIALLLFYGGCLHAQQASAQKAPPAMRLCVDTTCVDMKQVGDHYEGHEEDAQATLSWIYSMKAWTPDHIEFTGRMLTLSDGVNPIEATFTGKPVPGEERIQNGNAVWKVGTSKSGTLAYTLTWQKKSGTKTNTSNTVASNAPQTPASIPHTVISPEKKASDFAPPPTPVWEPSTQPHPSVDFNGVWEMQTGTPGAEGSLYLKLAVFQIRTTVVGVVLEGRPYPMPGNEFFNMEFVNSPASNALQGYIFRRKDNGFHADTVEFVDNMNVVYDNDNQFHIDTIGVFHRLTHSTVQDVPCVPQNPLHISADEALYRSYVAVVHKDSGLLAACWMYVSAVQGNAIAQSDYAATLYDGKDLRRDVDQAYWWWQQSAMQGDYYGKLNLWKLFKAGEVVPASTSRATYWYNVGAQDNPKYINFDEKGKNLAPDWALQTSRPCDPANPGHVDQGQSLNYGRVAYQARALERAACWFTISAAQNNLRAQVYLGILNMYGLGVSSNPSAGFTYMKKAAEGGDPFGMAYLSLFYSFGMGTAQDTDQASHWFSQVIGAPHGDDAWNDVMGRRNTAQIAANLANNSPKEDDISRACEERLQRESSVSFESAKNYCLKTGMINYSRAISDNSILKPEEILPEYLPY